MNDDTLPDPNSGRGRARACGLALLDASRSYETHTLPAEHTGAALVLALVGRARRLLRAAYLLSDSGLEPEAAGPHRAFIEYVLMVRWLLSNDDTNLIVWQHDDARRRLVADDGVRALGEGHMTDEMRENTERLVAELSVALKARGIEKPRVPSVEQLAAEQPFAYVVYRVESQTGTHPSIWAADQLLSVNADGSWQLNPGPAGGSERAEVETYGVCAYSLLELLAMVTEVVPEAMIDAGRLDEIRADLDALRPSP